MQREWGLGKEWVKSLEFDIDIEVARSCPTLCDPMDSSLAGSSVHGIFQARVLEWVAISFSRRSSRPRDQNRVSCIVGRHFTVRATREVSRCKLVYTESESEVAQSCPTLCDPMACSLPGFSVHGIFQARILELPFPSPGDLPDPGIEPVSPAL